MRSGSTIRFGIDGCGVWSQAFSAMPVMPGVLATASNAGAEGLGDKDCPAVTAWQDAQLCCAYLRPSAASPVSPALMPDVGASGGGAAQADSMSSVNGARKSILRMVGSVRRTQIRCNLKRLFDQSGHRSVAVCTAGWVQASGSIDARTDNNWRVSARGRSQ